MSVRSFRSARTAVPSDPLRLAAQVLLLVLSSACGGSTAPALGTGGNDGPASGGSTQATGGTESSGGAGGAARGGAGGTDGAPSVTSCSRTITGNVTVKDEAGLSELEDVCVIDGDLRVQRALISRLRLPYLQEVSGLVRIDVNDALTEISLPALTSAGSVGVEGNYALTQMDLSALVTAKGLGLNDNPVLATLSLPALVSGSAEGDGLGISSCEALTTLSLPALRSSEALIVAYNDALVALEVPLLESVHRELHIHNNSKLPQLAFPKLTSCEGELRIAFNDVLVDASFPLLEVVGGPFDVGNNPRLERLRFPQLTTVEYPVISGNPALTSCEGLPLQGTGDCPP